MPTNILSSNTKCGHSINLPIKRHCTPTENCYKSCYARKGYCSLPSSIRKQEWVSEYLSGNNIHTLIHECRPLQHVRLSGTGDLLDEHLDNIFQLATELPKTEFWGMTRKVKVAETINNVLPNLHLMVSVDSSSPDSVWDYPGAMCWGPRLKDDVVPQDERIIVVFPYHFGGKVVQAKVMPRDDRDCLAVWKESEGCDNCGRCWNW